MKYWTGFGSFQIHPDNLLSPKGLKEIYMKVFDKDACNELNKERVDRYGPYHPLSKYWILGHNVCCGNSGGPLISTYSHPKL